MERLYKYALALLPSERPLAEEIESMELAR
jgi:hypothetical protein